MTADRDLSHLHPPFASKVAAIMDGLKAWCAKHRPGYRPIVTEGFRSVARQKEIYAQGRTVLRDAQGRPLKIVTQKNGTTNPSNHQSGLACDFGLVNVHGSLVWDDEEFWRYYGHLVRAQGLTWGGDWTSPVDKPHLEWPTKDRASYAAAARWKAEVGLR